MTGCKTDFLCTLYCHEDYIWSHWVLCGVHHMTRNNFAKLNSLQSYKGVLVLPWYNFHSCNLILVHPLMLVTWRDCGQLQKHFMREELFYLRVDNTVHVHDWRLIINVAKRNRNGEILTTGCEVRKNKGSQVVWICEIQGAQNMISTKINKLGARGHDQAQPLEHSLNWSQPWAGECQRQSYMEET